MTAPLAKVRDLDGLPPPPPRQEGDDTPADLTDTDMANASRFARLHGQDVRYTIERGWLVYDARRWAPDEKAIAVAARAKDTVRAIYDEIKDAIDQKAAFSHARRSQSKAAIQAIEWLARSEPGIPASLTDFDDNPLLLNVANGTLDLRTGSLRPHSRDDLLTKLADVEYQPEATCERWEGFLRRILADDVELLAYTQRLVGYLLTGSTQEQVLHFLYGLGANGKSVFCEVLQQMLGDYALVASPELIMAKRHGGIPNDVARLRGARVVFMNETSQGARFDEAKLKDLTGGDTLSARFLHAEFFDFHPTHKLVIRGNHKPAIHGTDEGIWRRLRLVPFTVQIPAEEQDRDMLEKLRAELPGILRWAVEGCLAWQREGLKPPQSIIDAVAKYREESDVLGRFIAEHCTVRKLGQVKASEFQKAYGEFCRAVEERAIPSKDLPGELERRGFRYRRTMTGRLYEGVELVTPRDRRIEEDDHDGPSF